MVWPEEGSGVVIGKVRRGRGTSESGRYSPGGPYGEPDYEEGWFSAAQWFELYAVRGELRGTDYILVPTWAVRPV